MKPKLQHVVKKTHLTTIRLLVKNLFRESQSERDSSGAGAGPFALTRTCSLQTEETLHSQICISRSPQIQTPTPKEQLMQRRVRQRRRATVIKVKTSLNFQSQTKISSLDVFAESCSPLNVCKLLAKQPFRWDLHQEKLPVLPGRGASLHSLTHFSGTSISRPPWHLLTAKAAASDSHGVYSGGREVLSSFEGEPRRGYECFIAGQSGGSGGDVKLMCSDLETLNWGSAFAVLDLKGRIV